MKKLLQRSSATTLVAATLASPFVLTRIPGLSILAMTAVLYAVTRARKLKAKQFARQAYLFGLVYFAIVMAWIYRIHATDLIPNNALAIVFKLLTFLIVMSALGTGFLLASWLYRRLRININGRTALFIPALWVVGEYFRSVFFSGFSMGRGGSFGPFWSFGTLGLTVSHTPLQYASRLVGLYGLSFLVVLTALVLLRLTQQRYKWAALLAIPALLSLAGYALYQTPTGTNLKVAAVGLGAEVETGYEKNLSKHLEGTQSSLTLLPEYSNFYLDSNGASSAHVLPSSSGVVVDSRMGTNEQGHKNIVTFYTPNGKILAEREKSFLIPAGEFVPYLYAGILVLSGNTDILRNIQADHGIYKPIEKEKPVVYKGVSYGALACSGAIAPNLYTHLSKQGAEVLTNSASISTLGVSDLYYKQASQMSNFIAVSNAKPFIQAARGGPSYILDKDGRTQQYTSSNAEFTVLSDYVTTNQTRTLYSQFGEYIVGLSAIALAARIVGLLKTRKALQKKHKK